MCQVHSLDRTPPYFHSPFVQKCITISCLKMTSNFGSNMRREPYSANAFRHCTPWCECAGTTHQIPPVYALYALNIHSPQHHISPPVTQPKHSDTNTLHCIIAPVFIINRMQYFMHSHETGIYWQSSRDAHVNNTLLKYCQAICLFESICSQLHIRNSYPSRYPKALYTNT